MLTKANLIQLYYGDGLTTTQIGDREGVSATTVQNWLQRHGIKSKPRHPTARPIAERFVESYSINGAGCWIWTKGFAGGRNGRYGMLRYPDGSSITAHRLSYTLHHGEIPPGVMVCHRCDVPACVNPAHLFLGSAADNMADCEAKGRRQHKTKITEAEVALIRSSDLDCAALARQLGYGRGQVWRIKTGRSRTNAVIERAKMNLR